MSEWGFFGWLTPDLRLWFFTRLHPHALAKIRRNKTLKAFVDEQVYPSITATLEQIPQSAEYEVILAPLTCNACACFCKVGGGVKHSYKIDPSLFRPSGSANFSRIDNTRLDILVDDDIMDDGSRFKGMDYYSKLVPWHRERRENAVNASAAPTATGIYMYSFSSAPEEHQPSGHANISTFSGVTLEVEPIRVCYRCYLVDGLPKVVKNEK
jgi:hypothetical protein